MPIQTTLSGAFQLRTPVSPVDVDMVLDAMLPPYLEEARRVGRAETQQEAVRRIGFAILSVHSDFDATVRCYNAVQQEDWSDRFGLTKSIARHPLVQYPRQKAQALCRLWTMAFLDGEDLRPFGDDLEYRERLRKTVWGLAWAKASFAVMLVKGQADVCCIDTHMHRLLTGQVARQQIGKRLYLELEQRVRLVATRREVPVSVVQHCLWDAMRGAQTSLLPDTGEAKWTRFIM